MALDLNHLTWSGIASALVAILGRMGWKLVQHDRKLLSDIHDELTVQRTNCLTTLQEQAKEQTQLLGKINDNLNVLKGYVEAGK